jgi:hypothetical protein
VPFTGESRSEDETPAAFVTETMAELYLQQGFTQEALTVYRQLLAQNPRDEALRDRVAALEKGSRSSVGAGAVSDKVYDEVQRRHLKEPDTMRLFFANLMRRRVLQRYDDSGRAGHFRPEAVVPNASEGRASGSADSDNGHGGATDTSPGDADASSAGLAFIVPDGAAPPPGFAPGDEQRAEYRDDESSSDTSSGDRSGSGTFSIEAQQRSDASVARATPSSVRGYTAPDTAAAAPPTAPQPDAAGPTQDPHVGSITSLFGDTVVEGLDEAAAKVLSGAFPVVEAKSLGGRPAERAKNELSLDNVFREADRKTGRNSGGFSFDQFFSDGSGGSKTTQRSTDPSGSAVGGPDLPQDDDVAQFNDWLSGLKKK